MTKARVKIMICYINHICLHLATTYVNLWRLERKIAWMDIVVTRLGGTGLSIINRRKKQKASKVSTNVQNTGHISKEFIVSLVFWSFRQDQRPKRLKEGDCILFFLS